MTRYAIPVPRVRHRSATTRANSLTNALSTMSVTIGTVMTHSGPLRSNLTNTGASTRCTSLASPSATVAESTARCAGACGPRCRSIASWRAELRSNTARTRVISVCHSQL